jgi:hypothetical protein
LGEPFGRKLHQLAGRERHRRQAEHRPIPAARGYVEGVEQPAVDLISQHDRGDEGLPARPLDLRDRQARADRVARMNSQAADIDVVQVVVAGGTAVGEGSQIRAGAPVGADDGRGPAGARQRDLAADADRSLVESRDAATQRVDEMGFGGLDGGGIDVGIAHSVRIGGKPLGQRVGGCFRRRPGARHQTPEAESRRSGEDMTASDRWRHGQSIGSSLMILPRWLLPTQKVTGVVELSTVTRLMLVDSGSR